MLSEICWQYLNIEHPYQTILAMNDSDSSAIQTYEFRF